MILIFSEERDETTTLVCRWLNYYHKKFLRINAEEANDIKIIELQKIILNVRGKNYEIDQFSSFWFRRGGLFLNSYKNVSIEDIRKFPILFNYIKNEHIRTEEFFFEYLNLNIHKKLGNFFLSELNKLIILDKARQNGLLIPYTFVTSLSEQEKSFSRKFITKPISEIISFFHNNNYYKLLTNRINKDFNRECLK